MNSFWHLRILKKAKITEQHLKPNYNNDNYPLWGFSYMRHRKMKTSIPSMKLGLASAIAFAALGMTGCGGDDDNSSTTSVDQATGGELASLFNCTAATTESARVICIGSASDLTDATVSSELVTALSTAKSGDTIILPQGRFNIATELTFDGNGSLGQVGTMVENLTIRGAGMDKTILDFDAATSGGAKADGFFVSNTKDITFEDFGVYEAPNNAIKLKKTDGIVLRRIATVWETDYQSTNGAYGLYPVETQNVLIEDCYVKGSADAGVYVGQSSNIVVRNTIAEKNVAGIEIENSTNADVYGNTATGNTGGILIFDLPIGNGLYGSGVRIFNNTVTDNNAPNFANASDFAGGVHIVPPGTGVIILSTSDVEIYDNTITGHQTTAVALSSYVLADDKVLQVPNQDVGGADGNDETPSVMAYGDIATYAPEFIDGWSPLVRSINIHDNTIVPGAYAPQGSLIRDIILGYTINGSKVPDIIYDGIGELMAQIPQGQGGLLDITGGINAVAAGLYANVLLPQMNAGAIETEAMQQIPNLAEFGGYAAGDYVCASNNGDITQAAVFATNPAEAVFVNGEPQPQLLQSDESMTCGGNTGKTPYIGAAATATIAGTVYGCGEDDTTSTACAPE